MGKFASRAGIVGKIASRAGIVGKIASRAGIVGKIASRAVSSQVLRKELAMYMVKLRK